LRKMKNYVPADRHRPQFGGRPPPHPVNAKRVRLGVDRIIDTIRQALVVLDEKLRVISVNRAFCRTFNVIPENTIGHYLADVGDHRLDVPATRGLFDLLQAEDVAIEGHEIEIELPALGRRMLLLSAEKISGESEDACEIVMAIEDVTERKRAETTLRSAKWHAERATLSKSRFLAAASHDLRQPLQTLSLMRGILTKKIKEKKDEEALMLVARLDETADALLGMLDTLLDINQLEAGGICPERIDFPINDLLERLRIEFAFHAQAHGLIWRGVPCRLSIRSDPRLLEQMIRNLLTNAVKYTERGKILFGCRRRGDKLRIQVWDTGIGIPRDRLRAIFEEFHQVDNPAREHNRGYGLGLSIVQRLGKLLDHSVDVQTRIGKGSVFTVEVPLGGEPQSLPRQRRSCGVQSSGCHARILIVEADSSVREMLALLFTSEGYRTAAVADGKQAVALARGAIKPDIVVAAHNLPNGITGLQVVARVRDVLGSELPAVILTGDIPTGSMREITQSGCVQRHKPVRAKELAYLIRSLLADSRQPTVSADVSKAEPQGDMLRPTIFVVDDESSVREAMGELLREEGWMVEVYSSGEAFLEAYRLGRVGCLVVDARMPRMSGLELLHQLRAENDSLPAVMITAHADIRLAVRAMKAGAMAFLEKPVQYDELIVNIERALELTRNSAALSSMRLAAARRIADLTSRERQVVEMVVDGNPNKQIAYVLGINQRTVETHRATAMKKLGTRTLSELIHLAIASSLHGQ
jgi:two-component system, chemotaxis family, CheB/CheR fusion protein